LLLGFDAPEEEWPTVRQVAAAGRCRSGISKRRQAAKAAALDTIFLTALGGPGFAVGLERVLWVLVAVIAAAGAPQLFDLAIERLQPLALVCGEQLGPLAGVGLGLADPAARDSRWMPRSRATWEIGRPDSSARRTPRSLNSSGYFFWAGIRGGSPRRRTDRPRFEPR
jgi:hypothetical protein